MSTRDRRAEILEIKKRNAAGHGMMSYDLLAVVEKWEKLPHNRDSVPDFYLIRAVTILEVSRLC
jgi:hypothetical protein